MRTRGEFRLRLKGGEGSSGPVLERLGMLKYVAGSIDKPDGLRGHMFLQNICFRDLTRLAMSCSLPKFFGPLARSQIKLEALGGALPLI